MYGNKDKRNFKEEIKGIRNKYEFLED